jgi:hypothetical protein
MKLFGRWNALCRIIVWEIRKQNELDVNIINDNKKTQENIKSQKEIIIRGKDEITLTK